MAQNIKLEVVTPEKSVIDEEVQIVMAPGIIGEFGVLAGHTPFLTSLKTGSVTYKDLKGSDNYIFVSEGFAEALPDKVTILTQSAEKGLDIDVSRAKDSKERAERRLSGTEADDVDFERARISLQRAIHRLHIAESI